LKVALNTIKQNQTIDVFRDAS